jgi:hypothetical protein
MPSLTMLKHVVAQGSIGTLMKQIKLLESYMTVMYWNQASGSTGFQ